MKILSIVRMVTSCEEGDLSGIRRPFCKRIIAQQSLLKAVDDLIAGEYKGKGHWRLNCLVYAGAELVKKVK